MQCSSVASTSVPALASVSDGVYLLVYSSNRKQTRIPTVQTGSLRLGETEYEPG